MNFIIRQNNSKEKNQDNYKTMVPCQTHTIKNEAGHGRITTRTTGAFKFTQKIMNETVKFFSVLLSPLSYISFTSEAISWYSDDNPFGRPLISLHSLSDVLAYKLYHNLPSVRLECVTNERS